VVVGLVVVVYVAIKLANVISTDASYVKDAYVGSKAPYNKPIAVVFVHGIFGAKDDTWLNKKTSFPALLADDPEFQKQCDVFVFEYFTPKFGSAPTIEGLAGQLRGRLEDHRVFEDHRSVVFLSHSLGGLVVRQYLLNKHNLSKIAMLYFYATPTNGAELTKVARAISINPQLRGMFPLEENDSLQSIQDGWMQWEEAKRVPSYCAYETLDTYGVLVVPQSSAGALCNQPLDPLSANHIDIVKPADRYDPRYSRFAAAMRKSVTSVLLSSASVTFHTTGKPAKGSMQIAVRLMRNSEAFAQKEKITAHFDPALNATFALDMVAPASPVAGEAETLALDVAMDRPRVPGLIQRMLGERPESWTFDTVLALTFIDGKIARYTWRNNKLSEKSTVAPKVLHLRLKDAQSTSQ
jgi:pimeloyl-ACP methyl ester carboxylesterase